MTETPIIIGIAGPARAGKDTLAGFLVQHGDLSRASFAGPIRTFICDLLGWSLKDLEERKEEPQDALNGKTPRYAMQTLGTEWGRNLIGKNFWADIGIRRAVEQFWPLFDGKGVVFTDVRFENEAEAIRKAGGTIIHIRRPGVGIQSNHASEQGIAVDDSDWFFVNDTDLSAVERYAKLFIAHAVK